LQQIIFVAVQSTSLHSVLSNKCRSLSMFTYPGKLAIASVSRFTANRNSNLRSRIHHYGIWHRNGKWNTTICVAVVSLLLLLTWMPTVVWPMYNRCFGSLIWFPMRYDLLTLSILCVLVFSCLLLAAIISIQLMRTSKMDHSERVSASRMTYYLLVVAVLYVSAYSDVL
jgi:hypothetical protein